MKKLHEWEAAAFSKWQSAFPGSRRKTFLAPLTASSFLLWRYLSPHHPSLPFKSQRTNSSFRWERKMHHFPRGEDKYSPLCENLQVYMSPSPPHISGNRACHQIIHHVLKILCTMTGVFLKNKKIAIRASHYIDQATQGSILLHVKNVWLVVVSTRVTSKGKGSRSSIPLWHSNFLELAPMKFSNNSQAYFHTQKCSMKYSVGHWRNNKPCNILLLLILLQLLKTTAQSGPVSNPC